MTIIAKPRQRSKSKFYVYFNDWTGEILSVGHNERKDTPAPYLVTDDLAARKIVQGIASDKDYIVSSDRHRDQKLIHKNEFLQLRKQEDTLFLLQEKPLQDWDIRARLYTENNQLVIEVNRDMITKLVAHTHRRVMLDNRVDFEFFLIRKNDPDFLIKTIAVDAETLVNLGRVHVDISEVIPFVNIGNISILTRRYFENYYFETLAERFVPTNDQDITQQQNQLWQFVNTEQDAHIIFTQCGQHVEVSSAVNSEQLDAAGLHSRRMPFYLVGSTPDQYLAKLTVDIAKLRVGQKETFGVDFNIMDTNIMFHNPALKVTKRKI